MAQALTIGIAGLGTVGVGVMKTLKAHAEAITARAGREIIVTHVSARSRSKDRGISLDGFTWVDDPAALSEAPVDIVVELMGGSDGPALVLTQRALAAGKHVVTANKALIAHHGQALALSAEDVGVALRFEAAVAGGIPVLKSLCEGLSANRVRTVQGILNGTCNYILSVMDQKGSDFANVLADAQRLGYAEADPSFDIDGVDAAHKLAILASMAFGTQIDFDAVSIGGIRDVSPIDLEYARELGFRLKLIGQAQLTDAGLTQSVAPTLVPASHPLAQVEDSFNAVVFESDPVGRTVLEGRGAGEGPTASAVIADIIDIAAARTTRTFGQPAASLKSVSAVAAQAQSGRFYMRLEVKDEVGVAASIATTMRDAGISMESLLQRGAGTAGVVTFVLTTHQASQAKINRAAQALEGLAVVQNGPVILRIQDENGF